MGRSLQARKIIDDMKCTWEKKGRELRRLSRKSKKKKVVLRADLIMKHIFVYLSLSLSRILSFEWRVLVVLVSSSLFLSVFHTVFATHSLAFDPCFVSQEVWILWGFKEDGKQEHVSTFFKHVITSDKYVHAWKLLQATILFTIEQFCVRFRSRLSFSTLIFALHVDWIGNRHNQNVNAVYCNDIRVYIGWFWSEPWLGFCSQANHFFHD